MVKDKMGPKEGDLRVWWIPQLPLKAFYYPVEKFRQAIVLLDLLAKYDIFQFENNIKPDYCNTGGIEMFEDGEWVEWCNEDGDDLESITLNGGTIKNSDGSNETIKPQDFLISG